ncbi:aminodeoxychorismate synthase component I [Pokkaliibacter sp. MBI-7]|uniref:aminodeoxychorismate synthase component I n=1 Tax=Pokkaliibacter sp. MBI-7 TaxID=3040600 RepID=UPI00244BFF78|nr:aminodeoxychorismate synthase component I [Pokkaliibacter sp. MBI-7]MDH2435186.1 aminodeoxychorismate synthase component I [Pokkaliibacter sp. MBI-7]
MQFISLPYLNAEDAFVGIKAGTYPVLLDSNAPHSRDGRFDIAACDPLFVLSYTPGQGICLQDASGRILPCPDDPFLATEHLLLRFGQISTDTDHPDIPFYGGLLGYWSYDLGRVVEHMPQLADHDIALPDMYLGLYSWARVTDHAKQSSWLVIHPQCPYSAEFLIQRYLSQQAPSEPSAFELTSPWSSNMDRAQYGEKFRSVKDYIHAGDCYQVNLAQRFSTNFRGDSWQAYLRLRKQAPTPFAAYLSLPQGDICCLSPERFLAVNQLQVETKPIKGTIPRGTTTNEDQQLMEQLRNSEKDRAENLMIVDLLRNDLGRSCEVGSVQVPLLFDVESYPNVHHLVSTVTGRLRNSADRLDLLKGAFPGGSITGAPKIRAMEIIEELEPHRRSVYCGSIGYISLHGRMDTNIAIRTVLFHQGQAHCWAGGGLVADSVEESEYQETLSKIGNLLRALA